HLVGLAGVPDVHRPEVGARRVGIADAVDDGELALIPDLLQRSHGRMEAIGLVEVQDLVVGDAHRRPIVAVQRIIERNDRVQIVVPTRELQGDQHGVLLRRGHAYSASPERLMTFRGTGTLSPPRSIAAPRRHACRPSWHWSHSPSPSGPIPWPARRAPAVFREPPPRGPAGPDTRRPVARG